MLRILDRYLLAELIPPFLFGVMGFIIVMLPTFLFALTDLIVRAGASPASVGMLLVYNLPYIIVLGLPVAYLFGTTLAIGRMTRDFEIIAMRSAGVSLKRIIAPLLAGSLVVSAAAFVVSELVVPEANHRINLTIQDLAKNLAKPPIKANTFFQGTEGRHFYIREVKPSGYMQGVFVFDKSKDGLPQVINAESARWIGSIWRLSFGHNYAYDRDGYLSRTISFKHMDLALKLNATDLIPDGLSVQEMSTKQMNKQLSDLQRSGAPTHKLEVALYKKWAVPLASFFAALIAAPLGLMFSRYGAFMGVGLSIMLVFVYYVTMQITEALGNFGRIPPFLGAWTSNILFLLVGAALVWRMDKN